MFVGFFFARSWIFGLHSSFTFVLGRTHRFILMHWSVPLENISSNSSLLPRCAQYNEISIMRSHRFHNTGNKSVVVWASMCVCAMRICIWSDHDYKIHSKYSSYRNEIIFVRLCKSIEHNSRVATKTTHEQKCSKI